MKVKKMENFETKKRMKYNARRLWDTGSGASRDSLRTMKDEKNMHFYCGFLQPCLAFLIRIYLKNFFLLNFFVSLYSNFWVWYSSVLMADSYPSKFFFWKKAGYLRPSKYFRVFSHFQFSLKIIFFLFFSSKDPIFYWMR